MMYKTRIRLVILGLCMLFVGSSSDRTIKLVEVLYRHGNRSPTGNYPTDPNPPGTWPQGPGQLTNFGKMQHFHLGEWFLERYGETLLNKTYIRQEIYVRSTDVDRTLMSAESDLAGLYPPHGQQIWNTDVQMPWQPIPVHTKPDAEDVLIGFKPCLKEADITDDIKMGSAAQKYYNDNIEFFTMVKEKSGLVNASNLWDLWALSDALYFEHSENKTLPEWANEEVRSRLKGLIDYGYFLLFGGDNVELKRLSRGVLLNEMVNNMIAKASQLNNDQYRMHMFSAHDDTIASFLGALDIFNALWPPTASAVILELYQENTGNTRQRRHGDHHAVPTTQMPTFLGDFTVDILYRNDSKHKPFPLTLPGCTLHCPLQKFIDLTAPVRLNTDQWEKECGNEDIVYGHFHLEFNFGSILALVGIMIAVIFFCSVFFGVLFPVRRKRRNTSVDSALLLEESFADPEVKVVEYKDSHDTTNAIPEPDASNWMEIKT